MESSKLKDAILIMLNQASNLTSYNRTASLNKTYPYIVYKLTSSSLLVRNREDFILEIDLWNDSNDDSIILQEAENIKNVFDYAWYDDENGFFQSHLDFQNLDVPTDSDISRINQRYILKVR